MLYLPPVATGSIVSPTPLDPRLQQALENPKYWRKAAGLPLVCMDGRPGCAPGSSHGVCGIALPGGTITVAVTAAHLLAQAGVSADFAKVCEIAVDASHCGGFPAGAHRASTAIATSDTNSGCAAADLVAALAINSQHLAGVITELGLACGLSTLDTGLTALEVNATGQQLVDGLEQCGAHVATLEGGHQELAIVFNHRTGWVLDRPALTAQFGDGFQVFLIDAWAYESAAKVSEQVAARYLERVGSQLAGSQLFGGQMVGDISEAALAAAGSFTFAALLALCAPAMPILQVREGEDGGVPRVD